MSLLDIPELLAFCWAIQSFICSFLDSLLLVLLLLVLLVLLDGSGAEELGG
jgi:hypothetical protein